MNATPMIVFVSMGLMVGCGGGTTPVDSGTASDTVAVDAGSVDSSALDAGSQDDSAVDAGSPVDVRAGDSGATSDVGGTGTFTLTSTAYAEGGVIPLMHACVAQGGANASPPLDWAGAPAGTMSYAVFFTDATTAFRHSAIYDIGASLTGLPANVVHTAMPANVPGAVQPRGYPGTPGYAGPCPGAMHRYRFTLYAIDVANLPGLTATSSLTAVEAAFMAHSLGTATLTGTYTPP